MGSLVYKLESPLKFSDDEKEVIVSLLLMQGKVNNPNFSKLDKCEFLCVCRIGEQVVSIGAIKPKTKSDFSPEKSDLPKLEGQFQFELGYCFTLPSCRGKGYSKKIAELLINSLKNENLMASTELKNDNPMVRILERNGFRQFGKPWRSTIHRGTLGLFLKFSK